MPHSVQPYYVRDTQPWAVEQEHLRHNQAVYMVGEWVMFALLWHLEDFQNGLVPRCHRCFPTGADEAQAAIQDAYEQPEQNRCPYCFGTTFEGGYKALIVRPAILSDTDESETFDRRGVVHPDDVDVESTTDFRVRSGDYMMRANGTRWFLRVPQRITLRTGFDYPSQSASAIGYNHARASQEDPTSVAFLIPPTPAEVAAILSRGARVPASFADVEVIRAPLIPTAKD